MSSIYSIFRSEEMTICQIYIKKVAAYACICELGEIGLVHFNNLNHGENVLRLRFVNQIAQCGEMNRIIRFLQQEIEMAGMVIPQVPDENMPPAPKEWEMVDLLALLENLEAELIEITKNYNALSSNYFNYLEIDAVLQQVEKFFMDTYSLPWSDSITKSLLFDTNDLKAVRPKKRAYLRYLTGTIPIEKFFAFERVLWRICRGNFFIRHSVLGEVHQSVKKFVFIVFFQGDLIEEKIRKICEGFKTSLYQCPNLSQERRKESEVIKTKIKDLQIILEQTDYHRRRVLSVAAIDLPMWKIRVTKVLATYYIMNQMTMDEGESYLIAECWIPTADVPKIQQALFRGATKAGSSVPPILAQKKQKNKIPPTYNRTNRLTKGFQKLIDAYGVGVYQELNPTPYTVVTFPFLFGVMFGDMAHGILVLIVATWMVMKEEGLAKRKIKNEIWKILFGGRYILLGMGMFTIYTGLIYNEFCSKSINLFGSAWKVRYNESTILSNSEVQLDPRNALVDPYIFGIDPVWDASGESSIITMNSFKMKVAIILGVTHMLFGMGLAAWNHIHFKNYVDLIGMCIPQIVFFSLFLYLAILILLKWSWYSGTNPMPYNPGCAPSILIIFIDMLLFKQSSVIKPGCQRYMFEYQSALQMCLVTLALLSIPVMFLTKPLYVLWKRKKLQPKENHRRFKPVVQERKVTFSMNTKLYGNDDGLTIRIVAPTKDIDDEQSSSSTYSMESEDDTRQEEWEHQDLSEVFIHQGIHTIENVLGSVSHTASYLRLWALSLAHDQLSGVLWSMVLTQGLQLEDWKGGIFLTFTFAAWALLTVAILVVMEGLSAFLHTLRLHWVEFQSKFYFGSGEVFHPFDFKKAIELDDEEE